MDLKKPLTFDEQLDKLIVHGMIVADREKAKDILKRVNYYRFTGYALQFRQEPSGSNYIEGTTFETVYHLYNEAGFINLRKLRMINITMKIISITKRVTRKLWKISAGRKIITKIV